MRIEHICYSETLDNLVVLTHIPQTQFRKPVFTLITEYGEDMVNKQDIKEVEKNLKLHLIEMETVCD